MKNKSVSYIVTAAMVTAVYVVLSYFIQAFNLASGAIQFRVSEALCILPAFTPAAIPGVFLGCLLFNLFSGCAALDVIFGSLATLIAAVLTRVIAVKMKPTPKSWKQILLTLPPIFSNAIIIPLVLIFAYGLEDAYWFLFLTVGAGEVISCGVIGLIFYQALYPIKHILFDNEKLEKNN